MSQVTQSPLYSKEDEAQDDEGIYLVKAFLRGRAKACLLDIIQLLLLTLNSISTQI